MSEQRTVKASIIRVRDFTENDGGELVRPCGEEEFLRELDRPFFSGRH